jgi:hypothetical protein
LTKLVRAWLAMGKPPIITTYSPGCARPVLATWDIRSKNGRFCFSFLRFLEAVACTDKGMQEDFVCLHL